MSLPWFRLYHRTVDDDKLRLLAFEDRWHYIALCCLKAAGLLDEPDSDIRTRRIAVKLGVQVRELDEIGRRLREVELVDEHLIPLAWEELQYQSDSSAARVKKHRENKRKENVKQGETLQKRYGNGAEPEPDTDSELEANASCASGDAPKLTTKHVMEFWNEVAPTLGKPTIRKLTPTRQAKVRNRIAQNSIDDFQTVFANIRASPFLRGDKGWSGCTFDWAFKAENFQKILEGNYND